MRQPVRHIESHCHHGRIGVLVEFALSSITVSMARLPKGRES